ncbi:MAG: glycosyltransferase [Planctomycetota bacterium]
MTQRTKVLLVRPTLGQGGADRVTLMLLEQLSRQQFDLTLALMRREGPFADRIPADVRVVDFQSRNLLTMLWPLTRLLRRERFDILFSTCSGTNPVLTLASKLALWRGQRLVLSERNVLLHGKTTAKSRVMLLAKRLLYRYADVVTAVSGGVRDDLVRHGVANRNAIQVVFNPMVSEDIENQSKLPVDHPWLCEREHPVILAAGRLVFEKGFDTLVKAMAQLRDKGVNARLLILGEGVLRPELERLVESYDLGGVVSMPGFDPNPFRFMSRADLFVLSSRNEGLPGVLIQAMACGTAAVSTDCPAGPNEIISEPGENGLLVPVDNVDALAGALSAMISKPAEERTRIGERGRQAVQLFRTERVMQNYERALMGT